MTPDERLRLHRGLGQGGNPVRAGLRAVRAAAQAKVKPFLLHHLGQITSVTYEIGPVCGFNRGAYLLRDGFLLFTNEVSLISVFYSKHTS